MKHVDGYPVNIKYEPVKTIRAAARLSDEDFERLMTSYHKPLDRSQYYLQEIEISYREVDQSERDDESVPED